MRRHALALLGYLGLALVFTYPLAFSFTSAIPGDGFDGLQNYWNLWWVRRALLDLQTTPFFTRELFYPTGTSLYFHTLNIFNGLWSLPIQLLTNLAVTYNVVVLFTFVMSGYGMFLMAYRVLQIPSGAGRTVANFHPELVEGRKSRLARDESRRERDERRSQFQSSISNFQPRKGAASLSPICFTAGFVFAFAPFRFAHLLGHMQVLSTEWIPFFALTVVQMRERKGAWWRRAFLPAFFLALNALCDWYYVLYLLIFAALVMLLQPPTPSGAGRSAPSARGGAATDPVWRGAIGPVCAGRCGRRLPMIHDKWRLMVGGRWSAVMDLMAVVVLFAIMLSPLLVPMLGEAASAAYLRPPFEETVLLSADLLAFVTPSEFHPWWGEAARAVADQFTSSASERTVFAGFTALALAALGVLTFRKTARFWLLTLATFFVLALGPLLHVLGQIVAPVPLPYAWLYALVPLVRITRSVSRFDVMVMLALAMLAALGLTALRARPKLLALCAVLIAIEYLAIPYPLTRLDVPPFYEQLRHEPGAFALLELPINWDRPDPLLYQTVHAHPLVTAYTSRNNPLSIVERTPILNLLRTLAPDIIQYDTRAIAPSVLSDLDVRYVIVHPLTMGEGDERTVTNRTLRQMFDDQQPIANEPNLVAYRVPPPNPYQPYITLGDGWSEVELVDGKPQRVIERQATLRMMSHNGQARVLHLTAHTAVGGARVVVRQRTGSDAAHVIADFDANPKASVEMLVTGDASLFISCSTPIVVESLELRAQ